MARLTKIYTRQGDKGKTRLGTGESVEKDHLQVEAYGTVDELNALLGSARSAGLCDDLEEQLHRIQSELLNVGGELCMIGDEPAGPDAMQLIRDGHVEALEQACDRLNESLGPLDNFILPGGTAGAGWLHLARCVCRRAERCTVRLHRERPVPAPVMQYLNRLSDLLFIMARFENKSRGVDDVLWDTNV
jgi:cob(I)alamin adenosyltransferase